MSFHPIFSCFIEIQVGITILVPDYPGCPGKEAVKRLFQTSGTASLST